MEPLKKPDYGKIAQLERYRLRNIAKSYFSSTPTPQNIYNGAVAFWKSLPIVGITSADMNPYTYTGIVPSPATKAKTTTNFIKFASKYRGKVPRVTKGSEYREFVRRFGDQLDMNKVTVDDVYSAMRGRKRQLKSLKQPHAEYNRDGLIEYRDEDGKSIGEIILSEDPNWSRYNVFNIFSKKPGTGRKLYDSAIEAVIQNGSQGVVSGKDLISAPKTYNTWKHYPTKKLIDYSGNHSNANMILDGGDIRMLKENTSGPVYLLDKPSQYVPVKHSTMFDPSIIDETGSMQIDLQNPSMFRSLLMPIIGGGVGYGLYNSYDK